VWVIRKEAPTADWREAHLALKKLYLGDQTAMLRLGPASQIVDGKIAGRAGERGTVFFGPYLVLPRGQYRVGLSARALPGGRSGDGLIRTEIVIGSDILAASETRVGRRSKQIELGFKAEPASADQLFEIRCWSDGTAPILFEKVELIER
jgi:hypothetical protein